MSLLDDVSIVVTPNGYKAGTLYGVLPTATEGSELVVNGDFASDTWWLKSSANVNISNGKGNYTAGTTEYFYKPNLLTVGKRYKLVYEITDFTTGYISIFGWHRLSLLHWYSHRRAISLHRRKSRAIWAFS